MKASTRSNIEPFRAMQIVAQAGELVRAGKDIVMMGVGQPRASAPTSALKAAEKAVKIGKIGYTDAEGIAPLRSRICKHYWDKYSVTLDQNRVFVTTGSSAGFILSFLALFDPGDRVAIPSPGYPAYRNILRTLSLEPVEIQTTSQSGWVITPQLLSKTHEKQPLQGALIANPNNPNGTMMNGENFRSIVGVCKQNNIQFISDEIYHGLTYSIPEISALEVDDDLIVINSFSKYFCMTGWRIGWMVVPPELIETVARLQQNAFICAPEISQIAALAAFDGTGEMEQVKIGYGENRVIVERRLKDLGIDEIQPMDGAFYEIGRAHV